MDYKLLIALVAVCVVQVHGDLTADVAAAKVSTEALIGDSNELIAQETAFYRVVSNDVFAVMQEVVAMLADFGVPQATLDQLLSNISVVNLNIQTVVFEQVFYVTELIELLSSVLGDLASNLENLENDSGSLTEQKTEIDLCFFHAVIDIDTEMRIIKNNIADLSQELTLEQAGEVEAEMARAGEMVNAQFDLVVAAKKTVDVGIEDLTGQLDNIVVQLQKSEQLARRAA